MYQNLRCEPSRVKLVFLRSATSLSSGSHWHALALAAVLLLSSMLAATLHET